MFDFQGMGSSNFAAAGKAAADDTLKSFLAARRNSPNMGQIVQKAAENRSYVKQAAIVESSKTAQLGIEAKSKVDAFNIKAKSDQATRKSKRKAGVVAAAGQMIGKSGALFEKPSKGVEVGEGSAESRALADELEAKAKGLRTQSDNWEMPEELGDVNTPNDTGTETVNTNLSTPSYTPPQPGKIYTKPELQSLAVQGGFDPKDAPLVAKIAMGESSGNPSAFNGEGRDQSYGLMQINMLGDMGPERRSQFGISSNEALNDPLTNMKAAHAIYQQQGWGAWGAYTNGSYANQ